MYEKPMIAVMAHSKPKSSRNVADMPHSCMKALKNPSTHYDICTTIMVSIGYRIVYRISRHVNKQAKLDSETSI
jgi:hypothetical protein